MLALRVFAAIQCILAIYAAPTHLAKRATPLSSAAIGLIPPSAQFARAAYCSTDKLKNWSCGEACDANSDFQPTLVGGDGNSVQNFFVGFSPSQNSIVISHEGTDPLALMSVLTDLEVGKKTLDPTLFPGVSSDVLAHDGFVDEHAITATQILNEVKRLMTAKGTSNVMVIGHSLGGALAELDALFLTLNLPSTTNIKAMTFGTPRVGNGAFVQLFDSKVANFKRINNLSDLVPIVPGRGLGFEHPQGEVHLLDQGAAVACAGDDNASDPQCQIQTVPNVFEGSIPNHLGPYEGVHIGTLFCT